MNQYITPDRVEKLASISIFISREQILSQLLGIIAQVSSNNRPQLTSDYNGKWTACLASDDPRFKDELVVQADTPENAVADLILAYVYAEALKQKARESVPAVNPKLFPIDTSKGGFRSRRPTDSYS